ncbi:amino acid ABC transporter ATP-binding protein [Nitratireductor indicus]|uniref:amino acid ABC transporter ATP-binding protein n=1 Tax=Nitratireductor indicus TaxID=721133 RepID=UPI0028749BE5|nr:amino acid ABC transporter ATP-binding protein [Nitratireductor indicus]MDS1138779.1 amino acid ABC transporter ATP-binding protein [Nitratireductor indicus]
MMSMVEIKNVWKSYGSLSVLEGIDLQVKPGEVTCIVGPSGSGKSTLLRCINHLETIDYGRIYVDGKLVGFKEVRENTFRQLNVKEICTDRASVGMVFQQFNLFPHLTVEENIMLAPVEVLRRPKSEVRTEALALLERVGLEEKAGSYPSQLSGGQQQRVAIARALAMKPKLMLFDEATSALDPELVGDVLEVMRSLAAQGMTMIVVTHEIGFAREVADQLVFMADGHVVESGDPRELLSNPRELRTQAFLARVTN